MSSDYSRCDAVVIGGGFAGVAAARELSSFGLRTTLVEARDRLGGRTWTTDFGDQRVDLGGGWVHWGQPHVWAELTRYGIEIQEDDWRFDAAILGSPPRRFPAAAAFERIRELFARYERGDSACLRLPFDPLRAGARVADLDALSMQDRLAELDLDEDDVQWLSGLLYEIAGAPLDQAGLLVVLRWIALCGGSIDGWYETNKFRPVGGTASLIEAMAADPRIDVRLASPVTSVEADGDTVGVVGASGERWIGDVAVVAVPVNLWPHITFTPHLPAPHAEIAEAGVGKPHQDKVWIRVRGTAGRLFAQLPEPEPLNLFWTYDMWDGGQLLIGINANPDLDVNDRAQVEAVLRRSVPEIDEVLEVRGHSWSADEYARGGNACHRPSQVTGYLESLQQPWGRIAFATTDIASGWVGYIDGAIESGMRAARQMRRVAGV